MVHGRVSPLVSTVDYAGHVSRSIWKDTSLFAEHKRFRFVIQNGTPRIYRGSMSSHQRDKIKTLKFQSDVNVLSAWLEGDALPLTELARLSDTPIFGVRCGPACIYWFFAPVRI